MTVASPAPRALLTADLAAALVAAFDLDRGGLADLVDLGGGCNLTLRALQHGCPVVVRLYRPHVTATRTRALQDVRRTLREGGVPCVLPLPAADGDTVATVDGLVAEAEPFVEADGVMKSWPHLRAGMPLLARIHSLLAAHDASDELRRPRFTNDVEAADALPWARRAAERIGGWDPTEAEKQTASQVVELAERLRPLERDLADRLPRQLVHGDFWDDNVLFAGDRPALVTDFDMSGERARIDDLALTLFFWAWEPVFGDRFSPDAPTLLADLADRYDAGLDEALSDDERRALPLALARQPLWSAARHVADVDDEDLARRLVTADAPDVRWGLHVLDHLDEWEAALRGPTEPQR